MKKELKKIKYNTLDFVAMQSILGGNGTCSYSEYLRTSDPPNGDMYCIVYHDNGAFWMSQYTKLQVQKIG